MEGIDIAAKGAFHAGAQYFYRHFRAGFGQPCLMHLRDRRGGNGFGQFRKRLCQPDAQFRFDLGHGLRAREGGQLVLQIAQLVSQFLTHHIGAGGQRLPRI